MNYVDIAVISLVVLFVIIGFSRGFLRTLTSLASTVLALGAAFLLSKAFANVIGGIGGLKDALGGAVQGLFKGDIFNVTIDLTSQDSVTAALVALGIPDSLAAVFAPAVVKSAPVGTTTTSLAGYLGPVIVNFILVVISFILIYIFVKLIMRAVERFIKKILLNKTLRAGDRILGAGFGLVKAYFVVCVLLVLLSLLAPSVPALQEYQTMLDNANLAKTIQENNIINKLIELIIPPK